MKKSLITVSALALSLFLTACSPGSAENSVTSSSAQWYETSDGTVVYNDNASKTDEGSLIERNGNKNEVSSPENSISIEKATSMLDTCAAEDLYLPQSVKNYEKYYSFTVNYGDALYYSFDFYVEKDGKRVFAGTNCLVACDGTQILKEDWMGGYVPVKQNKASSDKSVSEMYGNVKITPNEALLTLASFSEKELGLEYSFLTYTFETDTEISTVKGIKCYKITPKLYYTNSVKMLSPYYVSVDGKNRVFTSDGKDNSQYIEIK